MKKHWKKTIVLIEIAFLLLTGCKVKSQGRDLSLSLGLIFPDGSMQSLDLETGQRTDKDVDWLMRVRGEPMCLAVEQPSGMTQIICHTSSESVVLAETEMLVWGLPALVGADVYFIGKNDNEQALWRAADGEISRASSCEIKHASDLCFYEDMILYVAQGEHMDRMIVLLQTETGEETQLVAGCSPVWKENGKSFFYISQENALCSYDIQTEHVETISAEHSFWNIYSYDGIENVFLATRTPTKGIYLPESQEPGLYFAEENVFVPWQKYGRRMGRSYWESLGFSFWADFISCSNIFFCDRQ